MSGGTKIPMEYWCWGTEKIPQLKFFRFRYMAFAMWMALLGLTLAFPVFYNYIIVVPVFFFPSPTRPPYVNYLPLSLQDEFDNKL